MEKSIKKPLLVLFTCLLIVCDFNYALAQKGFQIGFSISPIYFHNKVEDFNTFNKNQINLAYGLNLEYNISKTLGISFHPTFFKRYLRKDCIDTAAIVGINFRSPNAYYISQNRCTYRTKNIHSFVEFPVFIKYIIRSKHKFESKKYILIGNSFLYRISRKDILTELSLQETFVDDKYINPHSAANNQ